MYERRKPKPSTQQATKRDLLRRSPLSGLAPHQKLGSIRVYDVRVLVRAPRILRLGARRDAVQEVRSTDSVRAHANNYSVSTL